MIRFIADYRDRFTVELICATLEDNHEGGFITSGGCLQSKALGPKRPRSSRRNPFLELVRVVQTDDYVVYAVRKIWQTLQREGFVIVNEQTARLMRLAEH